MVDSSSGAGNIQESPGTFATPDCKEANKDYQVTTKHSGADLNMLSLTKDRTIDAIQNNSTD